VLGGGTNAEISKRFDYKGDIVKQPIGKSFFTKVGRSCCNADDMLS
jgi:hypothetical protein